MARWNNLPLELRWMIFELVASTNPRAGRYAPYATVSTDWQHFFERLTFRRIVVDQDRLPYFEGCINTESTTSRRRQRYLKRLCLYVKLDPYGCMVCRMKEDSQTADRNNIAFTVAIWRLMQILSSWTTTETSNGDRQDLTLELGAYSPSDWKHTFRDFRLQPDYPYREERDLEEDWGSYKRWVEASGIDRLDDSDHRWFGGSRGDPWMGAKKRVMNTLIIKPNGPGFSTPGRNLPKAHVVSGLVLRRAFYRRLSVPALKKVLRALPRLSVFRYEGWHHLVGRKQVSFSREFAGLLKEAPQTLRQVSLFEDFSTLLHPGLPDERADVDLSRALSKHSRHLEHVSGAFLVDAEGFFQGFYPSSPHPPDLTPWANLQTLALTSPLLRPAIYYGRIASLLMTAGRAAALMPRLRVMEIWNGGSGHATIFRYSILDGTPTITWASNWGPNIVLGRRLKDCWAAVRSDRETGTLVAETIRLPRDPGLARTFASAIPFLQLRRNVVDVISDYQLRWEEHHPTQS
ncbi:hypothetical protein ACJ41O_003305 [Fusarium nematophilum]